MSVTQIDQTADGRRFEPFLVPAFSLQVGPTAGRLTPLGDVTRVSYRDGINVIDSATFTVANADWAPGDTRYTSRLPNQPPAAPDRPTLLPGAVVRLRMGYATTLEPVHLITGRIVGVTPNFSADGAATATVTVLSELEELRERTLSRAWPSTGEPSITDSEIAWRICAEKQIEAVIPAGLRESGHPRVTQTDETNIAFLLARARARGYIVCFRELLDPGATQPRKVLYFGPSNLLGETERRRLGERPRPYELAWGRSLLEFRPTINVSTTLWRRTKLGFWDRRTRSRVPIDYDLDRLWRDEPGLNQDLEPLVRMAATAEHELAGTPVHTADEGRDLVRNALRENVLTLLTAEGTCVGLPELRACSKVEITGVGRPFAGTWFVTSTTHTIDDNGYRTTFSARREQHSPRSTS